MHAQEWLRDFIKFWMVLRVKNTPKMAFLPLFAPAGTSLGRLNFGGANDLQIQKFHLGWIVDRQGFPTSYHELNFDFGKCLKITLKVAQCIEKFGPIFTLQLRNSPSFD